MDYRIVHFEIPANDIERCKKFYEDLFGWKIEKMPVGEGYYMVTTGEDGTPGINGGMMQRMEPYEPEQIAHVTTNYVNVDDLDAYVEKATGLGAQLKVEKTDVGGMGWFAVLQDTEYNTLGLWQDAKQE